MRFILFAVVLCSTSFAHAQTRTVVIDESRVRAWAEKNQAALQFPSLAVGIVDRSGSRAQVVLGSSSGDAFLLGSLSKSVTALATMLLVEEEILTLDAEAHDFYSSVPAGITVEMLLHQTSGLDRADGGDAWTNDSGLEQMIASATWGAAGEFSYSNLNYQILGGIIEKVSGQTYAEFVQQRIFEPLELENASASGRPEKRAIGHQYLYGFPVAFGERAYNRAATPSGFVWMSPDDMDTFLGVFINRGRHGERQVFSEDVIDSLLNKPSGTRYAMGWLVADHEPQYLNHAGATSSFTSAMALVPGKWGVYALSNLNTYSALGTVTAMQGLLAMLDVIEPRPASNAEFVIRLVVGAITLIFLFALLWRTFTWIRQGFPLRVMPSRRLSLGFVLVTVVGVVLYIVFGMGTSLQSIAMTQPDIFITFVAFTVGLVLWQFEGATLSSAIYYDEELE